MSSLTNSNDLFALNRVIETYCLTVTPDTLVNDAITLMLNISYASDEKASCVLVTEDCRLVGILTQADALRLAASGKISSVKVADVMRREVISLKKSSNQDAFTALQVMHQHGISHLPVVDDNGNLQGIIEEKSLLRFFVNEDDGIIHKSKNANSDCKQETNSISAAETQIKFDANILAHVSDAVIAIDNEHKIIYLNKRAEQQYSINAAEFVGR
ncbi:MAG: CBS domain-containing protein, partial [Rivularia sp. (in: cyanobacteria)]